MHRDRWGPLIYHCTYELLKFTTMTLVVREPALDLALAPAAGQHQRAEAVD